MISAALLGSAVVAQDAFPFGSGSSSQGIGGFGFGPAAQQQEFYSITGKASVTTFKAGEPFYIALNGKVADTYHAYWRNPGSVGEPITATLKAPEGFKVEGPYWEVPHRVAGDFSTAYSYEAPIAVWKVTPEATAPQQAEFTIESSAQTCNDMGCNPAETKTTTVSVSAGDGTANADWAAEESKVETLGETPVTVSANQTAQAVTLTISGVDSINNAYFFSEDNSINPAVEQELKKTDAGYTLTLPRNDNSDPMHPAMDETLVGKELKSLKGIRVQAALTLFANGQPVAEESGELLIPLENGLVTDDKILQISDVLYDEKLKSHTPGKTIFIKTVGMALFDVVCGNEIYKKAVENGIGTRLEF